MAPEPVNEQRLAARARIEWGLPHLTEPAALGDWLQEEFGARPVTVSDELWANLEPDPAQLIDRSVFFGAWQIAGPVVRERLASATDLAHACPDDPAEFEETVAEFAPQVAEVARLWQRMELVELVLILVTHQKDNPSRVGNFFVQGPGQHLTEQLWAVTAVLPSSQGAPASGLYKRACETGTPA